MIQLRKLLFELSNEDRLNILFLLKDESLKLSDISKKLSFTVQETSRNVSRLNNANLVLRKGDSSYQLTTYGKHVLDLLPGFEFLSKHVEYFESHTLSRLPPEFFSRIGDLVDCTIISDVMLAFYEAEKMMDEAEKFLYIISDQHLMSSFVHLNNALERKVKIKGIVPADLPLPDGYFDQEPVRIYENTKGSARRENLIEERWIGKVETCMGVSDKLSGRIFFPNHEGSFDYKGFTVVDERSHEYCKDLFKYYWSRATTTMPEHLLKAYSQS